MHGSLNWFRYLPICAFPTIPGELVPSLEEKENHLLLVDGHYWFDQPPQHYGWCIDPVIITPNLYKKRFLHERPLKEIWAFAKEALSACRKLVIIRYSFSPSVFATKQLLLESLSDTQLEEAMQPVQFASTSGAAQTVSTDIT
jgi:hypothetical protein